MALYGNAVRENLLDEELEGINLNEYVQLVCYDDISRGSDAQVQEFCESELAEYLQEAQVLNKKAMMRLDKASDSKRRTKLIAYQLAKEANDPAWKKMVLFREKMKEQRAILMKKYGKKAQKIAVKAQKEYIKAAKSRPSDPTFGMSDGKDDK